MLNPRWRVQDLLSLFSAPSALCLPRPLRYTFSPLTCTLRLPLSATLCLCDKSFAFRNSPTPPAPQVRIR